MPAYTTKVAGNILYSSDFNSAMDALGRIPNVSLSPAQSASYIIFTGSSLCYARNGTTGIIDYSGSNAGTIIQTAINAIPSFSGWGSGGGIVFLREGIFLVNSKINIPQQVEVIGSGVHKTVIKLVGSAGNIGYMFSMNTSTAIRHLELNGNVAGGQSQTIGGIDITGSAQRVEIKNIYINTMNGKGIMGESLSHEFYFDTVEIVNSASDGMHLTSSDLFLNQIDVMNSGGDGIVIDGPGWTYASNLHIGTCTGSGFTINSPADGVQIVNLRSETNMGHGVHVATTGFVWLTNVEVLNNGYSGGWANGIYLDGAYNCTVIGGHALNSGYQSYGLKMESSCLYNTVIGFNCVSGGQTANMLIVPNNTVRNCFGFVTENKGTLSISAQSGSFAHGLYTTPLIVNITASGSASSNYLGGFSWYPSGSAGVWAVQTGSGTVGLNWYAQV